MLNRNRRSRLLLAFTATAAIGVSDAWAQAAVEWTHTVHTTASGAAIQKTGGCNGCPDAGATSLQMLEADSGWIEFTPTAGGRLLVGLGASQSPSTDPALIDFAFSFWPDGGWDIRERNLYRTEGTFAAGDTFRIAVEVGRVKYYRNAALIYTSKTSPSLPLVLDTTLYAFGAAVTNAWITVPDTAPPPPLPVTIDTAALPDGRVSQTYAASLSASGGIGPRVWTLDAGSLPQGLTLDSALGTISGMPGATGRSAFTIRVADMATGGTAERDFVVEVRVAPAPNMYDAIADRNTREKGPLPVLGAAGHVFHDPVFGTRLRRITDGATRPGILNRSYRTPSAAHSNAWSADGRYFYTVSTDGTILPYAFDAQTATAERLQPTTTGEGGRTLRFFAEPTFSYVTPGVLYGTYSGPGSNLRSADEYSIQTDEYRTILNLDTLVPGLTGTYIGALLNSGGPVERLIAFFGGSSQDRHMYLVVFDKNDPSNRRIVDTLASTVDGGATNILLDFKIHGAAIDRSGRYVTIYPTGGDLQAPRSAAPAYVWDTVTNTFTATPLVAAKSGGHDAYGYGVRVNQDCCTSSTWDAAQWQFRSLATPLVTADLVAPVLLPKAVYMADHPSWHHAAPDRLVPFLNATYRYGANTTAWRAWDDEILAVQTDAPGSGATVWRFAHHRSNVANDNDPSRISFWYTPRVNVSPDGRWALFTSNWEKTLGTDPRGDTGAAARQDLFLIELRRDEPSAPPPPDDPGDPTDPGPVHPVDPVEPLVILTSSLPDATRDSSYAAQVLATGGEPSLTWSIVSGSLPQGLVLDVKSGSISGIAQVQGMSKFTVSVTDSAGNQAAQALSLKTNRR